jgi:hypothetical protein
LDRICMQSFQCLDTEQSFRFCIYRQDPMALSESNLFCFWVSEYIYTEGEEWRYGLRCDWVSHSLRCESVWHNNH